MQRAEQPGMSKTGTGRERERDRERERERGILAKQLGMVTGR